MRPGNIRISNQRTILEYLRQVRSSSKAVIADECGISRPTAGKIIDGLIEAGVVRSMDQAADSQSPGRPNQLLCLDDQVPRFCLIEMGVQTTLFQLVSVDGTVHHTLRAQSGSDADAFLAQATAFFAEHTGCSLWAGALSMPGVVDEAAARVLKSPNMPWTEQEGWFASLCSVAGCSMTMVQEVRARALSYASEADADDSFLYVWNGDGLGAALLLQGNVFIGPSNVSAELGHTPIEGNMRRCGCGNTGCLETLIAEPGLCKTAAVDSWQACCDAFQTSPEIFKTDLLELARHVAAAVNVSGVSKVVLSGNLNDLSKELKAFLNESIAAACLWNQFGRINISYTDNSAQRGLVACLCDRFLMTTTDWKAPCQQLAI